MVAFGALLGGAFVWLFAAPAAGHERGLETLAALGVILLSLGSAATHAPGPLF